MCSKQEYLREQYRKFGLWSLEIEKDDPENVKWWKGISIHPDAVPVCLRCEEDTRRYKTMTSKERLKFKPDCCRYCLWWDWFDKQRKQYSKWQNI